MLIIMIIIYQTEVEQLTVTRDPGDVGEQCSNTWQPLQPFQVVMMIMMMIMMMTVMMMFLDAVAFLAPIPVRTFEG